MCEGRYSCGIRDEDNLQNFGHLYHAEGVGGAENWRRHLQSADRGSEGNENGNENTCVPDDSKGSFFKNPSNVLKAPPLLATR